MVESYPFDYFRGYEKLDDSAMSGREVKVLLVYYELTITNRPQHVVPTIISTEKVLDYYLLDVDVEIQEQFAQVGSIDMLGPKYQVFELGEE